MLCYLAPCHAQTWFPPSTGWLAQRLRDAGCAEVRHDGRAVGGLLRGEQPGPTVVFSSNDPIAAIEVLKALGIPEKGDVLAVFGNEVKLKRGDFMLKVDFTAGVPPRHVALPLSGPSIDSFELVITGGPGWPAAAVGSDLVMALQNRARTASEHATVQLEDFRAAPDGRLAVDLSLRIFRPEIRDQAAVALEEITRERLALHKAELISLSRTAAPESGSWPLLRQALAPVSTLQEAAPQTALSQEDFGLPNIASVTLRAGSSDKETLQGLARVLQVMLAQDR